jgi:hypothetical protein
VALEKTRQREIRRHRLDGPVHTPPPAPAPPTASAPAPQPASHKSADVRGVEVGDADKAKLAQRNDKAPVTTSIAGAGNARNALLQQVQARRDNGGDAGLDGEARKLLRDAYKELSQPGASLDDHLALRALMQEKGSALTRAFDEIMIAHATALLPELLERAHIFDGPAKLRDLRDIAAVIGRTTSFDAHVTQQLVMARSWSKGDDAASVRARADVDEFAEQMGLVLPNDDVAGTGRTYEASAKHHAGTVDGAFVSPAPTDGQKTLDASVQVKPESTRRVGIDREAKEYVVFDETVAGVFHGHRRSWLGLHPDMRRALVDAGLCDKNGKLP